MVWGEVSHLLWPKCAVPKLRGVGLLYVPKKLKYIRQLIIPLGRRDDFEMILIFRCWPKCVRVFTNSVALPELNLTMQVRWLPTVSAEIPLAPSHMPVASYDPLQARAMDLSDFQNLRKWHRNAALRAKRAGFDIVYVYAGHQLSTISHFLSP